MRSSKNASSATPDQIFDESAEHVGGYAVVPARSRLEDQGLGGRGFHQIGQRPEVGVELDPVIAIERIDRVLVLESVGKSRRVDHEVVHGHRAVRGARS